MDIAQKQHVPFVEGTTGIHCTYDNLMVDNGKTEILTINSQGA